LREEVATKTDLAALRTDLTSQLAAVRAELAAEIAAVRAELSAEIAAVKADLTAQIVAVRTEVAAVKHDILRWMVGLAFAQAGLTVALIRFLPH
jgi:hypothetical protein